MHPQILQIEKCVVFICFVGVCLFYLSGCASSNPNLYPSQPSDAETVYLLDNHWHFAVILLSKRLPARLREQLADHARDRFVAIGWGDEGFFRAPKITAGLAVQALFFSRGSVIQVFGLNDPPPSFEKSISIYRITLSHGGVDRIVAQIDRSFMRQNGALLDAGPSENGGRFYFAQGHYSAVHTCNQWTADLLHRAGMPISPAISELAGSLEWQLQRPGVKDIVEYRHAGD